jgi:signal transduction histidine kinase
MKHQRDIERDAHEAGAKSATKSLNARSRILLLALIMIGACTAVVAVTMTILYRNEIDDNKRRLQETAKSQARLIEAVARYDARTAETIRAERPDYDPMAETLSQIADAHAHYKGFGETGEFTLARRDGNSIIFILRHRHSDVKYPAPVAFDSDLAEPMRRALEGLSGTVIGLDYRGETVLAAYEPVAVLNLGIVAKVDMSEVRKPFIRSGLTAAAVALFVVLVGATLFFQISNPIVERLEAYSRDLKKEIEERERSEEELNKHREHLENLVRERTTQLDARVTEAQELNSVMVKVMEDLRFSNVELKATGRELMASNKELATFSYSVSHDLRAPLRHIDGFVKLLVKREKERLDPTSSRYLETIAESSNRMGRLIDDLLAFSRTGRAEVQLQPVDSNEVVREARKGLFPLTEGRRVTWEVGDLPAVEADRGLLRLVWENLIGNAIKYTGPREEARIEIGATREEGGEGLVEIAFFVRDNGVGFDPRYVHKLFGVFQRLHHDDEFQGSGIGLATVGRIVHRHGGRVWAEGRVDHGATFYFTLREARGEE